MKKMLFALCLALCLVPIISNAQESSNGASDSSEISSVGTEQISEEILDEVMSSNDWSVPEDINNVNCSDYYKFQSVQVSLGTEKDYYKPGETVHVVGEIVNKNNQPITNGNVFVRVSQKNGNYIEEGNFIVDEFIAIKDISLQSNESIPASFDWKIPDSAPSSEYIFNYFFSVGKKFNLGGLPFSNEIIIGKATFDVVTDQKAFISFNRSATKVNNQKYYHIGDWPIVENNSNVVIDQPIVNSFSEDKNVEVAYDVFYWDSLNGKDLLTSSKEQVIVPANSSVDLKYTVKNVKESVYYVRITAISGDQKSIINIRFVNDVAKSRLNYPAITKFPIKKGDEVTLFTCFHNTSGVSANGKVVVKLLDKNDEEITSTEYEGVITSNMMADKNSFVAKQKYDNVTIKAQVFDNGGQLVDEYEVNYNCEDFNACESNNKQNKGVDALDMAKYILFGLAVLLFIGVVIFIGIKLYKQK